MPELIPEEDLGPYRSQETRDKTTVGKIKRFIIWLIRASIHSLIFYFVFFNVQVPLIEAQYSGIEFYFVLVMNVMLWTVLTDVLSTIIIAVPILLYYYFGRYTRGYKRRNYGVWLWEYIIYVVLRVAVFALMVINLIAELFGLVAPEDVAFILAWFLVSLGTIFISKVLAKMLVTR